MDTTKLVIIAISIAILGVILGIVFVFNPSSSPISGGFRGNRYVQPNPAYDFELIDQYGNKFKLSDYKGKIIVLSFIYTHCPDICPAISAGFSSLEKQLKEKGLEDDVVLVLVSVDPERDTPERLREWMQLYDLEGVYLLTGDINDVSKVWNAYGVFVKKEPVDDPQLKYLVAHSGIVYIINKDFRVEIFFLGAPPAWSADDIMNDIEILLRR